MRSAAQQRVGTENKSFCSYFLCHLCWKQSLFLCNAYNLYFLYLLPHVSSTRSLKPDFSRSVHPDDNAFHIILMCITCQGQRLSDANFKLVTEYR